MRIFGICLIKNEADIIEYTLQENLKWADKIFVYDNGSTDGTWQIIKEMSQRDIRIVPWKSESRPYDDGLRAEVFAAFRHEATKGDWWNFIMDSDELYIDDPREFLREVPSHYQVVATERFEYRLTHEDLDEFEFTGHFEKDRSKIRFYNPRTHSEKRFFRHRNRLRWSCDEKFPDHVGVVYEKLIRAKHFQYRNPQQMELRIQDRIKATQDGYTKFMRDNVDSWREKLEHRENLIMETPEFRRDAVFFRSIPWYHKYFRMGMHLLGIYP